MPMEIRTISSHNLIPVIDPVYLRQSPDEFLAENGGFLNEVAVIAKSATGFVHYRSATAPANRETSDFFSTFTSIADSIGIKVHAFINGLADSFLGKNRGYSAVKDGGNPIESFICPTRESYSTYLASILNEVTNFPIQGLIIDNIRFPREEYCFCERCSRKFSAFAGIDRIFSLGDLQKDPRLLEQWKKWRQDKIEQVLATVVSKIKSKTDIPLRITMDIDPVLNAAKGAVMQFGQDIDLIGEFGLPVIHLSAWTPLPSSTDSPEYQVLKNSLNFLKAYQKQSPAKDVNLFVFGVESETALNVILQLKEEMNFNTGFIQNHFPQDYQKRRELHLGLN